MSSRILNYLKDLEIKSNLVSALLQSCCLMSGAQRECRGLETSLPALTTRREWGDTGATVDLYLRVFNFSLTKHFLSLSTSSKNSLRQLLFEVE